MLVSLPCPTNKRSAPGESPAGASTVTGNLTCHITANATTVRSTVPGNAQGQPGALLDRPPGVTLELGRHGRVPAAVARHRVAPVVAVEKFRDELGAQAAAVARGPVDVQSHGYPLPPRARHRPARCSSTSAENASSVLRTNRAVPSGWWQAPRPVTSAVIRRTSSATPVPP